jgi:hypothetical protein
MKVFKNTNILLVLSEREAMLINYSLSQILGFGMNTDLMEFDINTLNDQLLLSGIKDDLSSLKKTES